VSDEKTNPESKRPGEFSMSTINATAIDATKVRKGDKIWFLTPTGKPILGTVKAIITDRLAGKLAGDSQYYDRNLVGRVWIEYGEQSGTGGYDSVKLDPKLHEDRMFAFSGLRPTTIGIRGGWIEIMDRETGKSVMAHNIPWTSKTDSWVKTAVRKAAALGFEIKTKQDGGLTCLDLT
jgi:hypothetical protein